jgi:hypothetical protein
MTATRYILKTQLLILVSAVASNPHGQFDLHRARRKNGCRQFRIWGLLRLYPIFKLRGIEHDDSLVLVFLKQFIFLGLPLLLSRGSFPFPLDTASANFHFTAVQRGFLDILSSLGISC